MVVSKRKFIRYSLASTMALAVPWQLKFLQAAVPASDREPPERKFKTQLNGGLIGVRASQPQLNELASRWGFESITASASYLSGLTETQLQDLTADMRRKNISFGLGLLNLEFRKSEDEFKKVLKDLRPQAAALQKAGVTRVSTWIMSNHSELNYLQNFRFHTDRLRQLASILADFNIRFGLEYVGPKSIWAANRFPFIHTMAELKELIAAIDKKNVGIHLDTAHWFTAGESLDSISALKNEEIVGCDVNDALEGITPIRDQPGYQRELPATTGIIDIKSFLTALIKVGYDGFIQAEPFNAALEQLDNEEATKKTAASMKKAIERL